MQPEDRIRWQHMIDAAEDAMGFMRGRTRADLDQDRMLAFAVVRAIEIIGEAASKVTPQTRTGHPEIPWPAIIGMRNRLVHAYFEIDANIVWAAVTEELPSLLAQLKAIEG
jgi:uncharacterized protein with HEPN domain